MASTPRRVAFFSLPAQRKEPKERAALPLRRPRSTGCGTGGARTRCAQTACPFFPVPHPAARLSAKGLFFFPGNPPCPEPPSWRGQPSTSRQGILRGIVPTLQRENAAPDAPASASADNHQQPHLPPSRAWPAPTEKSSTCGRSGPCPRYQPRQKKKKDATSPPLAPPPLKS